MIEYPEEARHHAMNRRLRQENLKPYEGDILMTVGRDIYRVGFKATRGEDGTFDCGPTDDSWTIMWIATEIDGDMWQVMLGSDSHFFYEMNKTHIDEAIRGHLMRREYEY